VVLKEKIILSVLLLIVVGTAVFYLRYEYAQVGEFELKYDRILRQTSYRSIYNKNRLWHDIKFQDMRKAKAWAFHKQVTRTVRINFDEIN